jgi:hypothetical protein
MNGMRMPFEKLMELVEDLDPADAAQPMGVLAARWGEPSLRIMDAVTAVRVLRGERTYIPMD